MRSDTYVDWATTISANWGGSSVLDALLKKLLVIPYQQIADVVRHGETITSSGLEPHKLPGFVPLAGVDFSSDHLKCYPQGLDSINAGPHRSTRPSGHSISKRQIQSTLAFLTGISTLRLLSRRTRDREAMIMAVPQNGSGGSGFP
jgi:hypothetical protein